MSMDFYVEVDGEQYNPAKEDFLLRFAFYSLLISIGVLSMYFQIRWYFKMKHSPVVYLGFGTIAVISLIIVLLNIPTDAKLSTRDKVLNSFSDCNIGFSDSDADPVAKLDFEESDSTITVTYEVREANSGDIVNQGLITVDKDRPEQTGIILAYRLFKIDFTYDNSSDVEGTDVEEDGTGL